MRIAVESRTVFNTGIKFKGEMLQNPKLVGYIGLGVDLVVSEDGINVISPYGETICNFTHPAQS